MYIYRVPLPFIRTSIHMPFFTPPLLSILPLLSLPLFISFLSSLPPPSLPSTLSSLFPPLPIPRVLTAPSFCTSSGSYSRLNVDFDLATPSHRMLWPQLILHKNLSWKTLRYWLCDVFCAKVVSTMHVLVSHVNNYRVITDKRARANFECLNFSNAKKLLNPTMP